MLAYKHVIPPLLTKSTDFYQILALVLLHVYLTHPRRKKWSFSCGMSNSTIKPTRFFSEASIRIFREANSLDSHRQISFAMFFKRLTPLMHFSWRALPDFNSLQTCPLQRIYAAICCLWSTEQPLNSAHKRTTCSYTSLALPSQI